MTPTEKRIALFINDNWEDKEDCLGDEYKCIYADHTFIDAVQDCRFNECAPTDVLCIEYAKHEDGREFVQLFISTHDDECQEWFSLSELSRRDRLNVVRLFDEMVAKGGFRAKTPVIAI